MSCICAPRHEVDRTDLHVRREGVPHLAAARQRDQRRGLLGRRPGQVWHLSFHDPMRGFHHPFFHTPIVWFLEIPVIWVKKCEAILCPLHNHPLKNIQKLLYLVVSNISLTYRLFLTDGLQPIFFQPGGALFSS
jgi:hypothetical protein